MRKKHCQRRMIICLLGLQLFCFVGARSQSAYAYNGKSIRAVEQKDRIEENEKKESLFNALKELNRTKGAYFLFSEQSLGTKMVNSPTGSETSIEKALDHMLKNSGLKFRKINEKTYVILSKDGVASAIEARSVSFTEPMSIEPVTDNITGIIVADLISGKITAADGTAIAGVSVAVKGTRKGTATNAAGEFTIEAKKGDVLVVSYIGYQTQEVTVSDATTLSITLQVGTSQLNEVVVTALGIQRQAKSLTYSVQKIGNDQLTTVKDASFVNSLTGKVAGVTITKSSSGIGGSTRVVLRGNKSTRNNQPLYVVDGVPLTNYSPAQPGDEYGQSGVGYAGIDGGDGISNLNPEDIESISVLKGASAAALYGSAASNGVILVTTKKGKAGKTRVDVSSSLTLDSRAYKTPLQFKYGQTTPPSSGKPGSLDSWGSPVNGPNFVDPFFQTGVTTFNSIALSGGTERSQSYFSYSFTDNKGIEPTVSLKKHNINFRQTSKFFDDRLTADLNVLYVNQEAHNRPSSGLYNNPLTGLYMFPRGLDFNKYKKFETFSTLRNTNIQNWWDANYDSTQAGGSYGGNFEEQNPYWLLNRVTSDNNLNRVYTNFSLSYKINSWINLQARANIDKTFNDIDSKSYATTSTVLTGNNGGYGLLTLTNTQLYSDLLLSGNRHLTDDLGLTVTLGTSINDNKIDQYNYGTKAQGDGLRFANVFNLENILPPNLVVNHANTSHKQVQSAFGTAQLNYKNYLYLDLTARNDWSSSLAYTPVEGRGFFYYSGGLTAVLSDMFKMAEPITFSKFRISYAKVGNDVDAYKSNPPQATIDNLNGSVTNTKGPKPGTYLKPEDNRSFEVGTEWRFLKDRVGFDFTYYLNNNFRQYVEVPAPPGGAASATGQAFSTWYLNTGNIRNQGVELSVSATPVKEKDVTWTTTINYAYNKNRIVSIADPADGITQDYQNLTQLGNLLYASYIKQGGQWGDIYGRFFKRDAQGHMLVSDNGAPIAGTDSTNAVGLSSVKKIGNPQPRYTLGWNNTIEIAHSWTIGILFDGRFGGKVMSVTQALLDANGDSKATADARDAGGVTLKNAVKADGTKFSGKVDALTFYNAVGNTNGIGEYYMYDATAVRLREASLTYRIPVQAKWVHSLSVAVIGKNLFFITKKAPFDPELSMATSNFLQGVETFGLPSTRSLGASVKLSF
ncbi:MAG TPA: SusC/RagA family TonB-linked outer membrane protein [Puia sp.]|nr:SusC/RagA family TonB-linked outer membrane protein [Puia sp.]